MEWLVLNVQILQQSHQALILESGKIRVIAHVNTQFDVKPQDIISPVKDAFYTINHHIEKRILFLSACKFTPECWVRLTVPAK